MKAPGTEIQANFSTMHSAALTVNMTSAHSMNDLNLTSHDLIMSAVGVPVTAQAGPVVPQGVLHTENATSGVVTNAVSVGSLNLQAVQQVPQQNPNATTPNGQKNSSNQKGQNSAKVNNRESSATATAGGMCDEKTVEYLRDLIEEKKTIENNNNGGKNHEDIHEIVGGSSTNASAILGPKSIVLRLLDQGKKSQRLFPLTCITSYHQTILFVNFDLMKKNLSWLIHLQGGL